MTWKKKWLSIDTDITGLSQTDRIITLAGVEFDSGQRKGSNIEFFNPGEEYIERAHPATFIVNRVTKNEVLKLRDFRDRIDDVKEMLSASNIWVGHNIWFDVERLQYEFLLAGEDFATFTKDVTFVDTRILSGLVLRVRHRQMLGLRQTAISWEVPIQSQASTLMDAMTSGSILAKMAPFLPDDIESLQATQKMAFRYVRSLCSGGELVIH
jgi:DNA polymerase III epsilon subunit-like protein